jgi:hypothetical protein
MSPDHDRDLDAASRDRHGGRDHSRTREGAAPTGMEAPLGLDARPEPGARTAAWVAVTGAGRHGGHPAARGAIARMQGAAGNAAVAGLLGARAVEAAATDARATRRAGPTLRHAGGADSPDKASDSDSPPGSAGPTEGATRLDEETAPAQPAPTSSSTKVGPPSASTYTVSGTLREAANAVAARPEAGATITTPDMIMPADDSWPTHVQVTVTQVVVLPEWDGKAAAIQEQRNEWDRFKAAITAHENGHVGKDVKAFANAHGKVKAKKTRAEGEAEFDAIIAQANTDNNTYDADTDHGRPATNINPNLGEVTKVP